MNDLPDVVVLSATRTAIGRYGGGLASVPLRRTGGRYAVVTMCIGGGQDIAAIFERA